MNHFFSSLSLTIFTLLVFTACASKAPITGRSQMIFMDHNKEMALGSDAAQQILSSSKLSKDTKQIQRLNQIGKRVAEASGQKNYKWEFYLIEDAKTPNAFVLPGGKVFVYTGILQFMSSDDELAAVVAHEVGHALARHGAERMSSGQLASAGGQLLQLGLGVKGVSAANTELALQAFGAASQLGVILPYSRAQEYEADQIGLVLAAKAGYNPAGALTFWQKFMQADKGANQTPE
jgi:predicted Zn-dependent protease